MEHTGIRLITTEESKDWWNTNEVKIDQGQWFDLIENILMAAFQATETLLYYGQNDDLVDRGWFKNGYEENRSTWSTSLVKAYSEFEQMSWTFKDDLIQFFEWYASSNDYDGFVSTRRGTMAYERYVDTIREKISEDWMDVDYGKGIAGRLSSFLTADIADDITSIAIEIALDLMADYMGQQQYCSSCFSDDIVRDFQDSFEAIKNGEYDDVLGETRTRLRFDGNLDYSLETTSITADDVYENDLEIFLSLYRENGNHGHPGTVNLFDVLPFDEMGDELSNRLAAALEDRNLLSYDSEGLE